MNGHWDRALAMLPHALAAHLGVSAAALLLAIAISVPLVLAMAARPGLRRPVLGVASVIQTIPAIALLALFYPLLLILSVATQRLAGFGVPALGLLPSLLALALYALLPLLRGGADGLASVPPAVLEAADGIGMTRRQRMVSVELPLASTIIVGGLRTAVVWTIGAATLATTVGQPSLGDLIFTGLQTEDWALVVTGCLAAAAVTIVADFALALIEYGVGARRRGRIAAGIVLLAAMALAALVPTFVAAGEPVPAARPVIIGAKNFGEQFVLAEVIGNRLDAAGIAHRTKTGLGSAVIFRALAAGDIDTYVDYTGTLWGVVLGHTDVPPRERLVPQLVRELRRALPGRGDRHARVRERLCAGDEARRCRAAAHPHPRRSGAPRPGPATGDRPRIPGARRMDGAAAGLWPALPPSARLFAGADGAGAEKAARPT